MKMGFPEELQSIVTQFRPEQVEVAEGDKNVMRPDVMQFLMLASIASQATKVRKYFDDRTSEGWTENFALVITPAVQEVLLSYPAQTFFLINDGAGQIFVSINSPNETETPLLVTETIFVDFETHKMKRFYVRSAPGTVATARAFCTR